MPSGSPHHGPTARTQATRRAWLMLGVGLVVFLIAGFTGNWLRAPAYAWGAAAVAFNISAWRSFAHLDAAGTAAHAGGEVPSSRARRLLLNLATVLSFATVILLLIDTSRAADLQRAISAGTALTVIVASWLLIHTVFTLRYAAEYFENDPPKGIDFNQDDPPRYLDFAYMAFSTGMTYQVSDTSITTSKIRTTILIHSFYAFIFGTAIMATTINLVVSLA
ncbi:hypothetical protein CATRI_08870 [Corynebacterium atrinae]|uniref:DUF1345 domain-containing protein n=1 Tax=Corynebacterium atrinae TaxID=1336740 RepID=UPI0025B30056|nr:DUF1345 domain-containing protein [Corynebacterium atrinae]WJY63846.1 hypothetical protein CATRI_08870 [Corynebacterium atrinae]